MERIVIPDRILTEMTELSEYLGDCDDWMTVKKLLLLSIPSDLRRLFSTRDEKTKKQSLNDFEKALIDEYQGMTGICLELKR